MANPTFDGTALTTAGAKLKIGSPQSRTAMGALVGVAGVYVQENPLGPRQLTLTGQLTQTAVSDAAADKAIKAAIHAIQALAGLSKTFVSKDGHTYTDCVLEGYWHGGIQVSNNRATCMVQAMLTHTVPSSVA